jgi:hypothetical protein
MRGTMPSLPQYAFMTWFPVKKHRDNLTFILSVDCVFILRGSASLPFPRVHLQHVIDIRRIFGRVEHLADLPVTCFCFLYVTNHPSLVSTWAKGQSVTAVYPNRRSWWRSYRSPASDQGFDMGASRNVYSDTFVMAFFFAFVYHSSVPHEKRRGSSVSIVTRLRAGRPELSSRHGNGGTFFIFITGSGSHLASYPMGSGGLFPGGKAVGS